MTKKLMNYWFSSGLYTINIGADSSDHLHQVGNYAHLVASNTISLNQLGALFFPVGSSPTSFTRAKHCGKALRNAGYGVRTNIDVPKGSKLYLVTNDPDPPYIEVGDSYDSPDWVLYSHEGRRIGNVFSSSPGAGHTFGMFAGKLYDDGTFDGNLGGVQAYEYTPGIYSNKIFKWFCTERVEGQRVIYKEVAEYLKEFSPVEPEGEYIPEGVGDFNASSDDIELPNLPTLSAIDTRMLRVYRMTSENLSKFNKFLWSDLFDVNTFKKLFTDPMQAVLNLNISPINVDVLGSSEIKLGNINTGVQGEMCQQQYQRIDFGTIRLNEYWASFADYSPYTRLSIYLPYVGVQSLSIDDLMNGTIQLVGYCDVLTGSILYVLKSNQVNRAGHSHNSVLYSWGGNCQYQIPLTANNMSSVISSITGTVGSVAGAIGATVATGGLTAPIAVGAIGSAVTNTLNAKTQIQRGGGVGGATGMFGVQRPYLILERPEQRTVQDFGGQIGNPADVTDYLGNFSGFIKVKAVHVENITGATEAEQTEIDRLLKDGAII